MIPQIIGSVMRALLQFWGGNMVAKGFLDGEDLSKAIGAIIFLITLAWSVWQKYRASSEPGGEFNPKADLRKPVSGRGGLNKGSATTGALVVLGIVALGLLLLFSGCSSVDRTPDRHETAAVVNTASKVMWTPVVFGIGVVTWIPVIVINVGDDNNGPIYYWPVWLTKFYWETAGQ